MARAKRKTDEELFEEAEETNKALLELILESPAEVHTKSWVKKYVREYRGKIRQHLEVGDYHHAYCDAAWLRSFLWGHLKTAAKAELSR